MSRKTRRSPVSSDKRFHRKTPSFYDFGTIQRWQHGTRTLRRIEAGGPLVACATENHFLDTIAQRGVISAVALEAAMRFKADYQRAAIASPITASYNPARSLNQTSFARDKTDLEIAAYTRWQKAVLHIPPLGRDHFISVICHDKIPSLAQLYSVRDSLDCLIRHYGLTNNSVRGERVPVPNTIMRIINHRVNM